MLLVETSELSIYKNRLYSVEFRTPSPSSSSLTTYYEDVGVDLPRCSIPNYEWIGVMESRNGLIYLRYEARHVCLFNPFTREFKEIQLPVLVADDYDFSIYGFGYDSKINDFKIVDISVTCEERGEALGPNSWTSIEKVLPVHDDDMDGEGVFVNGALHWLTTSCILAFDIEDETFQELPQRVFGTERGICVLGGCLCISSRKDNVSFEVWVMNEYGIGESWSKFFAISSPTFEKWTYFKPIHSFENGLILLRVGDSLVSYYPKHRTARTLEFQGIPAWANLTTLFGNLVSLNSGTYMRSQEQTEDGAEYINGIPF